MCRMNYGGNRVYRYCNAALVPNAKEYWIRPNQILQVPREAIWSSNCYVCMWLKTHIFPIVRNQLYHCNRI